MARRRSDYSDDVDYGIDEMGVNNYGTCPICGQKFGSPSGFECDSCNASVCSKCIRSYGKSFICTSCVANLPKKEQEKVGNADALVKPGGRHLNRSLLLWLALLLILAPVALGGAYFFYTGGRADYAIGAIILVVVLILYWDRQMERWI
jgi:hypothetical protein